MKRVTSFGRWALGCAAVLTLSFSPLAFAQGASAQTLHVAANEVAAHHVTTQNGPTARVAATFGTPLVAKNFVGDWQAKKKKRRAKLANQDYLPQPLVQIIPGSSINLLSRSSKLPLAIKNGYDNEVRVRVRVQPSNLKVLIPAVVEVVVPANTTITAKVPVNAIADGPVVLHATLESFSGVRLTIPVDINMNGILGVEDTVIYGFVGFIGLLGAFGVFRTVRKRQRESGAGQ
jgi:hypothetical protein